MKNVYSLRPILVEAITIIQLALPKLGGGYPGKLFDGSLPEVPANHLATWRVSQALLPVESTHRFWDAVGA